MMNVAPFSNGVATGKKTQNDKRTPIFWIKKEKMFESFIINGRQLS